MSLRSRLTALCVGLVALVLSVFAVSTFLVTRTRIYASFDDSLTTEANVVTALLPAGQQGSELPANTLAALDTQAAAGAFFQIRSGDGKLLYSSFRGSADLLPRGHQLDSQAYFNGAVAGQDLRLLYVPLAQVESSSNGYIEVGKPKEPTDEALTLIGGTLAGGAVLALILTVFPAYFIVGRALQPIREVSGLARRIEQTSDFSQRLQREHSAEEMAELIVAFNALISRIEHTLQSHNEFLAESSHELRRPLTNLRTDLATLRDPSLPESDRATCIDRMSREALAMSSLVGDLLLLTRDKSQAFDRREVDLSALCNEAVSRAHFAYPAAVIESHIAPEMIILGDQDRLNQLLRNLIENAVNYSPTAAPIALNLDAAGKTAMLYVRDSGYGIQDEELDLVFDRFYRGEQARSLHEDGVGLGLSIVKYVAEGHGGRVYASSRQGGGTVFTVELPLLNGVERSLTPLLSSP